MDGNQCKWCETREAAVDFFTLPEMGNLSVEALGVLSKVYAGDPICRHCSQAFLRGFTMGEKFGKDRKVE